MFVFCVSLVVGFLYLLIFFYCLFLWDFGCYTRGRVRCWVSSFECGFLSQRFGGNYFRCSFLLLLVFFVIFDLEVCLLLILPFEGVIYKGFFSYLFFICCLVVGYLVEVESGYVV